MAHEGYKPPERRNSRERNTVTIKTTDGVIAQFVNGVPLKSLSPEAKRMLQKVLRHTLRRKRIILSGQTKAIAVWIDDVNVHVIQIR